MRSPSVSALAAGSLAAALTLAWTPLSEAAPAGATCFGQSATIVGTPGRDYLEGTDGPDVIVGLDGSDEIAAGDGQDLVCGGHGADYLRGGRGADRIDGGGDRDSVYGEQGADLLLGGESRDRDYLRGSGGDDTLRGGAGRDYLTGDAGADVLEGQAHSDNLTGGSGRDQVVGGDGNDLVDGDAGDDQLVGGTGDDRMAGDGYERRDEVDGDDVVDGGDGSDTILMWKASKAPGNLTVDLGLGTAEGQGSDTLAGVESALLYSNGDDVLVGSDAANRFWSDRGADQESGLAGDDVFLAAPGDDTVDGGDGSDTADFSDDGPVTVHLVSGVAQSNGGTDALVGIENVTGSPSDDVITGDDADNVLRGMDGQDTIRGGGGNDELRGGANSERRGKVDQLSGGPGDDLIDGFDLDMGKRQKDTWDEVDFGTATVPVTVDLAAGTAVGEGTDTLLNIEDVVGTAQDDTLSGSDLSNEINGGAGNDVVSGAGGDDVLKDSKGDDAYDGGEGIDVITFNLSTESVHVDLSTGTATGQGTDAITGVENVAGSLFDDQITGDDGPNLLNGGYGSDTVEGGAGDDALRGNRGNDDLSGGDGADVLSPHRGKDATHGGEGDDIVFGSWDTDTHNGGPGVDTINYSTSHDELDLDLTAGTATADATDQLTGFENAVGTNQSDHLVGDAGDNRLDSGRGVDEITGLDGNDVILSGADHDRDFIAGGVGTDAVDYSMAPRRVVVDLRAGFSDGTGNDLLLSIENLVGSPFSDDLRGDDEPNDVLAGEGDDVIELAGGDDSVDGGPGTDIADGGPGTDTCLVEIASACE